MNEVALTRIRVHFHKSKDLRFIGHLDLHRSLERTLRRANLPVDYTKGFNPRIKLNLSTALPLGCTSTTELADFWMLEDLDEAILLGQLQAVAPPGLAFISARRVDLHLPSLQSQIIAVTYQIELPATTDVERLEYQIMELLSSPELKRNRRGKTYDLRPLIKALELEHEPGAPGSLRMVLAAGEGMTGRPEEVLLALGIEPADTLIERTHLNLAD